MPELKKEDPFTGPDKAPRASLPEQYFTAVEVQPAAEETSDTGERKPSLIKKFFGKKDNS